ncbi:MAG TPA: hypothetical protein VFG72_01035 [Marmoricola sp.]|nr:hypothetical protein [Marmoricola sp.]
MRRVGMGVVSGTGIVGAGVVVAGVSTYLFLSLAGRTLGPTAFGPVSVLWAMVFVIGPGLFLPIQQELSRVIAGQRPRRVGGHALRTVGGLASVMALVTAGASVVARGWITDHLLGGETALLWCFVGAIVSYAVMFLCRGVFSGLGDYRDVGRLIALESLCRLLIGALLAAGDPTPTDFGVAIALAPLASAALVSAMGRRLALPPGTPVAVGATVVGLSWLVAGSLLAQLLANAGPLAVQLLADEGQAAEAGRFLSALVVARVALYLFQAAQATVLPNLAALVASGQVSRVRRGVRDLVVISVVLVLVTTAGAAVLGGWAVRLLFGSGFAVEDTTMAILTFASGVHVLAATLNQAVIASGGHRLAAGAWLAGCAAYAAGTTLSADLFRRVEVGYLLGVCVAAAVLLGAVWSRELRGAARPES